eukprot:COSAG03_NODE_12530_length_543_cov_0.673423_1_plen_125_part_10
MQRASSEDAAASGEMLGCFAERDGAVRPARLHGQDGTVRPAELTPHPPHPHGGVQLARLVLDGRWTVHATAARFGSPVASVRHLKARCLADARSLRPTDRTSLRDSVAVVVRGGVAAVDTARAVQ